MTQKSQANELEQASAHYRTAGNGLLLLGAINMGVAGVALLSNSSNAFIAYDMMALFGLSFMAVGYWMRTQSFEA